MCEESEVAMAWESTQFSWVSHLFLNLNTGTQTGARLVSVELSAALVLCCLSFFPLARAQQVLNEERRDSGGRLAAHFLWHNIPAFLSLCCTDLL